MGDGVHCLSHTVLIIDNNSKGVYISAGGNVDTLFTPRRRTMKHHAQFARVPEECTTERIVIRDVGGPWDQCPTVTEDAGHVVRIVFLWWHLTPEKRLFYYNSEGNLDELLHDGAGHWTGFAPGPGRTREQMGDTEA
jgi:hypothetical protein